MLRTDLSKRIYGLDILRSIAILCVLLGHTYSYLEWKDIEPVFDIFTRDGVTIFFVLSGFLIGGILIKTIDNEKFTIKSLTKFWINRWLRTLPPYYFVLILLLVVVYAFNLGLKPSNLTTSQLLSYFGFLQNFRTPHYGFFLESWSLCVEEWFYLIVPVSLFILHRLFRFKAKTAIALTVVIIILSTNLLRLYRIYYGIPLDYHQVVMRLDSLMYGVLGAYLIHYYSDFWNKYIKTGLIIAAILFVAQALFGYCSASGPSAVVHTIVSDIQHSIVPIIVLLALPYLSSIKKGDGFVYRFFSYTSLISYSLYLLHATFIKYIIVENFSS
ncbi:acyltransferase family protein [Viscerimonas tarda]